MREKEYLKQVGSRIKAARNAKKVSLMKLAPVVGVHYSSLSMIETGRVSPNLLTLRNIANALNVDIKDFV